MTPDTYYMVLDYGRAGRETIINWESCSRDDVLSAVVSGDFNGSLVEVHCIDRNDGRWSDVSEDIARDAVLLAIDRYQRVPDHLRDFIDEHVFAGACDAAEAA